MSKFILIFTIFTCSQMAFSNEILPDLQNSKVCYITRAPACTGLGRIYSCVDIDGVVSLQKSNCFEISNEKLIALMMKEGFELKTAEMSEPSFVFIRN